MAPWVPFIIAFGVIALVISVLIVVNVVGGAVVAGTTRIGVLKSIGFTPAPGRRLLRAARRGARGHRRGRRRGLRQPARRADLRAERAGVPGRRARRAVLGRRGGAAHRPRCSPSPPPSARRRGPGAMSAVQAIATGRAPRPRHGFFAQRALARLTERAAPGHPGLRVARRPAWPHARHGGRGAVRRGGGDVRRGPGDVAEPRLQRHLARGAAAGAGQRAAAGGRHPDGPAGPRGGKPPPGRRSPSSAPARSG